MHQELSEQEQVRREALQEIINLGIDPFPAAEYTVTHTAEGIRDTFAEGVEMKDVSLGRPCDEQAHHGQGIVRRVAGQHRSHPALFQPR
jgi:lysyl-tRNA synthetase class II